jgi:hypothetical protein
MVSFQTKNPNLVKFWRAIHRLENVDIFYGLMGYFTDIWDILLTFGIFFDHLVYFVFSWYIFSGFGIMYQEKSGNPVRPRGHGAPGPGFTCVACSKVKAGTSFCPCLLNLGILKPGSSL